MLPQTETKKVSKNHQIIKLVIGGGLVLLGFIYAACFFIPRPMTLSYSSETCMPGITLFPSIHTTANDSRYKIYYEKFLKLGSLQLAAAQTCVSPTKAPKQGATVVASAPWGSWLARTHLNVIAKKPPLANVAAIEAKIAATKPLLVPLSQSDELHTYQLKVSDNTADCEPSERAVKCNLGELKLSQGKSYDFELARSFKGTDPQPVGAGEFETLKAVEATKASVKNKQIVYSKPKTFTVKVDKPLVSAEATLSKLKNGQTTAIETEVKVEGKTISITADKDLARETDYRLVIKQAHATDGSTLIEPFKRDFTMSGGPKVTGVSIGQNRVGQSATVIVSFDQAISTKQSPASFVGLSGGKATVTKYSASQVAVSLQSLPRCQPITLSVKAGIKSKYDITSKSSYAYNSRTICHTVSTIGSSRQGRAINSFTFGSSGPVTLFVGALHGNEVSSSLILQDWINELEANPGKIPKNSRVVVVPTVNPDGVAAGTRNNSIDVNLNRNFPTDNWVKDIDDTDGANKGGGGSKPLSEPEAKALANLSTALKPRLMISYHAVGSVVIGDPGGYSASYAAKYASLVGYRNATGQSAATFDYSITGSYEDWTIQKQGIPSMIVELGSYSFRDFSHHRSAFWAML